MVKYEWKSMPSKARLKKNTEQLKEGLKSSILGPQNLGSGGARAPRAPPGSASAIIVYIFETYHERSALYSMVNGCNGPGDSNS